MALELALGWAWPCVRSPCGLDMLEKGMPTLSRQDLRILLYIPFVLVFAAIIVLK